jgi:hypothetical protein
MAEPKKRATRAKPRTTKDVARAIEEQPRGAALFAEPVQATTLRNAGHTVTLSFQGSNAPSFGDVYFIHWVRANQAGITYLRSDETGLWDTLVQAVT